MPKRKKYQENEERRLQDSLTGWWLPRQKQGVRRTSCWRDPSGSGYIRSEKWASLS